MSAEGPTVASDKRRIMHLNTLGSHSRGFMKFAQKTAEAPSLASNRRRIMKEVQLTTVRSSTMGIAK
jgi:hypothetical protein